MEEKYIESTDDVVHLKEVKEIKNAIREHMLFIGLDRGNNVRKISVMAIGSSGYIHIDCRDIIRTALLNACDKVIMVHNHPSNSLKASNHDKDLTYTMDKLLEVFNIELLDHVVVTENDYTSVKKEVSLDKEYLRRMETLNNMILLEENIRLKKEIDLLKTDVKKEIEIEEELEEEF